MGTPHNIAYDGLEGSGERVLFTIDTHPSANILAAGEVSGKVTLYRVVWQQQLGAQLFLKLYSASIIPCLRYRYVSGQDCEVVTEYTHHPGHSCRALQFSSRGSKALVAYIQGEETVLAHRHHPQERRRSGDYRLYSASSRSGSLYVTDTETGTLTSDIKKAHCTPLYSLYTISERLLASGDESGGVKVWDSRVWKCVMSVHESKDFISDMVCNDDSTTLLATSGDGTLSAFDLRQKKLEQRSDQSESELLSLAIVKGGRKVVCGDGEGCLLVFNWGLWGDITDRFPGHPQSIDSLLTTSDSVVCSGCMDGTIRAVQILPNKVLTEVGRHTDGYPIDCMRLTHDRQFMVTSSQDYCKFWPLSDIPRFAPDTIGTVVGERDNEEEEEGGSKRRKRRRGKKRKRELAESVSDSKPANDFFNDLL